MTATDVERYRHARRDAALAVLEGFHALKHAVRFGAEVLDVVQDREGRITELAARLAPDVTNSLATSPRTLPADIFQRLAPTPPPTGVLALARRPDTDPAAALAEPGDAPVVLLERPTHLRNLGAAVRAAAAAGAAAVLATGDADPWHPAALRGSAGLHFALPVARLDHLDSLLECDRPLIALDPAGEPLGAHMRPARAILAFGTERDGVSDALLARADLRLAIPMRDGVSSLNLATAVAVVLYCMSS